MHDLPTLVTLRSALALRDEAFRYAYFRSAMVACGTFAFLALVAGMLLYTFVLESDKVLFGAAAVSLVSMVASLPAAMKLRYPRYPSLTLEELAAMRDEMGLSAENFQKTHNAVLHGTHEDRQAHRLAKDLLGRLKQPR